MIEETLQKFEELSLQQERTENELSTIRLEICKVVSESVNARGVLSFDKNGMRLLLKDGFTGKQLETLREIVPVNDFHVFWSPEDNAHTVILYW